MKIYIALLPLLVLQFSCSEKNDRVPAAIIDKDSMVNILVDVHLAEAASDNHGLTSPQINVHMAHKYDTLFRNHHTTYPVFKDSYEYYMNHPTMLSDIYSEVVSRLTTMQSTVTKGRKSSSTPHLSGDSASIIRR